MTGTAGTPAAGEVGFDFFPRREYGPRTSGVARSGPRTAKDCRTVTRLTSLVLPVFNPGPAVELPRQDVAPGGIVSDPALHQKAIAAVRESATQLHLEILGVSPSHLPGAEGNQEYFLHARKPVR